MKALRTFLLALGIPIGAVLLVWGGGLLYWHVRVTEALRGWEKNPAIWGVHEIQYGPLESSRIMDAAGCRAFPHLVRSLEESKDPRFLEGVTDRIWLCVTAAERDANLFDEGLARRHGDDWMISSIDSSMERRRKCSAIREWWRAEGGHYHQWWRFWSGHCLR